MLFRTFQRAVAIAYVLGMLFARDQTTAIVSDFAMAEIQHKADWFNRTVTPIILENLPSEHPPPATPAH
jgi:hypothetical protein